MKLYAVSSEAFEDNHVQIQYGVAPCEALRYSTSELATVDCVRLNHMQIRVGPHLCAFTVDALPDGSFSVICVCHPLCISASLLSISSQSDVALPR